MMKTVISDNEPFTIPLKETSNNYAHKPLVGIHKDKENNIRLLFIVYESRGTFYKVSTFGAGKMGNYLPDGNWGSTGLSYEKATEYLFKICEKVFMIDDWNDIVGLIKMYKPVL